MDLNINLYFFKSPDNIGFDVRGEVKIFDFGLAKGKLLFSIHKLTLTINYDYYGPL